MTMTEFRLTPGVIIAIGVFLVALIALLVAVPEWVPFALIAALAVARLIP